MRKLEQISRRHFLKTSAQSAAGAAAALSGPVIIPRSALGGAGKRPANDRLGLGWVGCGGQGSSDVNKFLRTGQVELVALCDVNRAHAEAAAAKWSSGKAIYTDFRKMLEHPGIDIVEIATPDHWHALISIAAAEAGKDVYCQKPMTLTIAEGRAMVNAVRKHNRILQVGSQQRSEFSFRRACELVRSGRIGKLQYVETKIGGNRTLPWEGFDRVPEGLDWDMYLGPAPWVVYNRHRASNRFRVFWDYSGGNMTDWGAHHNDIAQWGLDMDHSGPVEIEGSGTFPTGVMSECPTEFHATFRYKNGVEVRCTSKGNDVIFHGTDGWITCNRGNKLIASREEIIKEPLGPNDVRLYESDDHYENFLECVRTRKLPVCDVEIGHRSVTVCHLGNIAIRLGRKIRWDPEKEQIVGDEEAAHWVSRPMRRPWSI
ncbi:MAG: Gfo/Idh/MocA family oxidoreductase [Candidatus Sumerlaeia bacterium]|nr:Gfo/Idh/MocA family oxidoreductase [Candidatus Sumerlaeia bacterium]